MKGPEIVKRLSPPNIRDICVIILVGFDRRMRPLQDLCSFNGVLGGDFDLGNVFFWQVYFLADFANALMSFPSVLHLCFSRAPTEHRYERKS